MLAAPGWPRRKHLLWLVEIGNKGRKLLYSAIGVLLALTALYTAGFGLFDPIFHRSLAVGLSAILVLLAEPLALKFKLRGKSAAALWGVDLAMLVGMVTAIAWFLSVYEELESGLYDFSRTDQIVALVGMGVLLELTRRTMGLPLTLFGVLAIVYSLFGSKLHGFFAIPAFPWKRPSARSGTVSTAYSGCRPR